MSNYVSLALRLLDQSEECEKSELSEERRFAGTNAAPVGCEVSAQEAQKGPCDLDPITAPTSTARVIVAATMRKVGAALLERPWIDATAPEWDDAEACIETAFAERDLGALVDACRAYEALAQGETD